MVQQIEKIETEEGRVVPWWEKSKTYGKMWSGSLFDRMIIDGSDKEEQRIQRLREIPIKRPQGKRGYLSIWRAKLLTESYRETEGESAILRKAKGFRHVCLNIPIPYQENQLLMGDPAAVIPGTEVEPEFYSNWMEREVLVEEIGETMGELDALSLRGVEAWILSDEDKNTLK